ncbi:MAG: phenylalanine--tRNA ligase subunit beta [Parcubacteria group bacterium CG1_02_42_13]|nr:MAG: phenylalanine--tRNA ligase subunit beta [Parcubacteria group bacterium CG1_02_42_13]
MKFSYAFIKKLIPQAPAKAKLIDGLNMKAFETELLPGDAFEVKLSPNRYSDAASHWGIAREAAAIFNLKTKIEDKRIVNFPEDKGLLKIKVLDKKLCPRYAGRLFELKKVGSSPQWMKKILDSCGLRPINGVVDIMNYVMLETGQPLHAFDANEIEKGIIVRNAKNKEEVTSLDGVKYHLDEKDIVIADNKGPLAIAGVKGGKRAEVYKNTKRIIVEAANFDQVSIYKTMKKLPLVTDASLRFSHGLNPHLAIVGIDRATILLRNILGAKLLDSMDVSAKLPGKKVIEFDVDKFNKFIGLNLDKKSAITYLKRLGFIIRDSKKTNSFLVEPSVLRDDINIFEDLAEEVVRLCGLNELKSLPPVVGLHPAEVQDDVVLKNKIRKILVGFGFSEVYNYSFVGQKDKDSLELENPISQDKKYLRISLSLVLKGNLRANSKDFGNIRIFEVGRVWSTKGESLHLGIALKEEDALLHLKGVLSHLLEGVGLVEILMRPDGKNHLLIESDHDIFGSIEVVHKGEAVAEINLDNLVKLTLGENEYHPLPKYPAVMRDISIVVPTEVRVGEVMEVIDNLSLKDVEDVDLIDYFEKFGGDPKKKSLTFRIVFRSGEKTLRDGEVDTEFAKVSRALTNSLKAVIR